MLETPPVPPERAATDLRLAGVACATFGLLILLGWALQLPSLVQPVQALVPTQPNSALCLVGVGLGLAFAAQRPLVALGAGAAVVALSSLTLLQYVFGIELGIDRLFGEPFIVSQVTHPGRMAPTTALAHGLLGTTLILSARSEEPLHPVWSVLFGTVVGLVGFEALVIYLVLDPSELAWGELTRMALPTAVALSLLGGWLVLRHRRDLMRAEPRLAPPMAIAAAGTVVALGSWQALLAQRGAWLEAVATETAETTAEVVQQRLSVRLNELRLLATHLGSAPTSALDAEATALFAVEPSLLGLLWIHDDAVRWQSLRGLDEAGAEAALRALDLVAGRSTSADLRPPDSLLAVAVPTSGVDATGHLVAVSRVSALQPDLVPREVRNDFVVTLMREGRPLADSDRDPAVEGVHSAEVGFTLLNTPWSVQLVPHQRWVDLVRSGLPEVLLVLSVGLSLAVAGSTHVSRVNALRSRQLAIANTHLRAEIEAHTIAREALSRSHAELERRVHDRTLELRRAVEDLARSNQELEHFAAVASHDLKEPLNTVRLYLQLLSRRYGEGFDERASEWLEVSTSALARMASLVDDLLAYARIDSAPRPLEPVAPATAIDAALADLASPIASSRADVVVHHPLPPVMADPGQLARVFQNLVSNALKFSADGPPRVDIRGVVAGDEVRFTVRDEGPGIDEDRQQRIFEMFGRAERAVPGTGIGLATCKRIVERHGGRIGVESSPGHGATFWFTLMAAPTLPEEA